MRKKELYRKAMEKWGNAQIGMMIEECSELITVLAKYRRKINGSSFVEITEEMADVEIMLEQMKVFFDNYNVVELEKEEKLKRLENLLKDEKEED